jgi:hypothetical protein
MAKIPLTIGAYEARSILADAQKSINLYQEKNPKDSPFPFTLYQTPGLDYLTVAPVVGPVRAEYKASNGNFYVVVGANVYTVSTAYVWTLLGTLSTSTGFVSITDNTLACVIVDGSANGRAIKLSDNTFGNISATNFFGANTVAYMDTYLIFNRPGTNQFYFTYSNATYEQLIAGTAFDPLDIAGKTGGSDNIVGLAVMHRELWLIGELTSEVWFNAGGAEFAFQAMPGAFIEHGCTAVGSIAKYDLALYWLGQDAAGNSVVFEGAQYRVRKISTNAIDNEISAYPTKSDALGFCYQQEGHIFYVLNFPAANATWVNDVGEAQWHRRSWSDEDGGLNRWRANCFSVFNNLLVVGDFESGKLYALNLDTYLDAGDPIIRTRSFPHITQSNDRSIHTNLILAMEVGNEMSTDTDDQHMVSLRWSDDAGRSYGNAVLQTLGATGGYDTSIQFTRLGLARDRVYEASWSAPVKTVLQGAYLDLIKCAS